MIALIVASVLAFAFGGLLGVAVLWAGLPAIGFGGALVILAWRLARLAVRTAWRAVVLAALPVRFLVLAVVNIAARFAVQDGWRAKTMLRRSHVAAVWANPSCFRPGVAAMQADPTVSTPHRLSALNRITTKLSLTLAPFAVGDTLIGPAHRCNQFARPPPGR